MKKTVYRICLAAIPLIWQGQTALAQQGVNVGTAGGISIVGDIDAKIKGSPYLYDNWISGSVKLADGTSYNNIALMYDVMQNRPIFKSEQGNAQTFTVPVKEFSIDAGAVKHTFQKGFPAVDGGTPETFYELLSDGNTKFLKRITKQLTEEREAGSIVATKQIKENYRFYIFHNGVFSKIKKDKKSILAVLNNKAQDLEAYIANNKLDLRNEDDIVRIINYYNRLS